MLMKLTPGVNFINMLRMNFLYKHHFGSFFYVHVTRKSCQNTTFVRKIHTFNVDEIDFSSFIKMIFSFTMSTTSTNEICIESLSNNHTWAQEGLKEGASFLIFGKRDSYPALKLMWQNWQKIWEIFEFKIGGKYKILKILVRNLI